MKLLRPRQVLKIAKPYGHKLMAMAEEHKAELALAMDIAMGTGAVIFSAKATPKALALRDARIIAKDESKAETAVKDAIVMAPAYFPTALLLGGSIASAIGGYKIQSGKIHTLATACSLAEHMAMEYQDRVIDKIGEEENKGLLRQIVDEGTADDCPFDDSYTVKGSGEIMYRDMNTGVIFLADDHIIEAAVGHVNTIICSGEVATVNDFYDYIPGVDYDTKFGEEACWSQFDPRHDRMIVKFSTTLKPDGTIPKKAIFYDYGREN